MADEKILTYLQDVMDAILDMESCFVDFPNRYDLFILACDNVQPEFLWSLVIRHIPELKKDIERLLAEYEDLYNREN